MGKLKENAGGLRVGGSVGLMHESGVCVCVWGGGGWGKDNFGALGASARAGPTMVEKVINVGLHDWFFVDAIVGLVACNRLGCTGIDAKLEAADRLMNAGGIKAVPIVLDDRGEFSMHCRE